LVKTEPNVMLLEPRSLLATNAKDNVLLSMVVWISQGLW